MSILALVWSLLAQPSRLISGVLGAIGGVVIVALTLDWSHPAVVGLVVGFPSVLLGYFVYRRSVRADEVAAQAGIASTQVTSIGQVVDGLNKIIENLREDNEDLRGEQALLRERVESIAGRLDAVRALNMELREKVGELERLISSLEKPA